VGAFSREESSMDTDRSPGRAWCVTEDKPAEHSCASNGHDTGPLDSSGKRTAFLLAQGTPGETVETIVAALDEGRQSEETAQ
jgi:hypothetical protein